VNDVATTWSKHGATILETMAIEEPARFAELCGRLIPRDVSLTVEQRLPGGLSPSDLAIFQAIKAALPGANDMEPGEVLQHTLDALRSYGAKPVIEGE
jgi:hypothetical protein